MNRSDFETRNSNSLNSEILCKICKEKAKFIPCSARLYVEQDKGSKTINVKHWGIHTCPQVAEEGCDRKEMEQLLQNSYFLSRQGIIRQEVGRTVQTGTYADSVNVAKKFTNQNLINNIKKKIKAVTHPHGQSFHAVRLLKEAYDTEDEFLIFDLDEGRESGIPFVVKSSRRKVEIMNKLDHDGCHSLDETVVHLDVIHSRTKSFKTYTLSYYDVRLNSMVVLCTMDTVSECKETCTLFFEKINEMLTIYTREEGLIAGEDNYMFNPFHLKDDEHGGNKIGMANVLGKEILTFILMYHHMYFIHGSHKILKLEFQDSQGFSRTFLTFFKDVNNSNKQTSRTQI